MNLILLILLTVSFSTGFYMFLIRKTKIRVKYLYTDNVFIIIISLTLAIILSIHGNIILAIIVPFLLVGFFSFILINIRFWRIPWRKVKATEDQLISPADGNIIYIKEILNGEIPSSIKNKNVSKLTELESHNILENPCWLIGINMTLFDVHKNCAPVDGEIVLNKHTNGKFLSLKDEHARFENERNTLVIKNRKNQFFGIIQIASKRVKRIDSYVKVNQNIEKGDWFGMIRLGSQVDFIFPKEYKINVDIGQQVYARKTILAEK